MGSDYKLFTDKARAEYDECGVTCVRNVIDPEMISALSKEAAAIQERSKAARVMHRDRGDPGASHVHILMHRSGPAFHQLVFNSRLPGLAASFFCGQSFCFFYDQLFIKEPHTRTRTQWHQDLPYWPLEGVDVPSFWVALTSTDRQRSAVAYIKGSHVSGAIYTAVNHEERASARSVGENICPDFHRNPGFERSSIVYDLLPGDVVIHHPLVVHGAGPNQSDTRRMAVSIRYAATSTIWRPGPNVMTFPGAQVIPPGVALSDQSFFPQLSVDIS